MNTKDKSNISEAKITAKLLEAGKTVLEPYGDNERYDLATEDEGEIERIQVKTATSTKDGRACKFSCSSSYIDTKGLKEKSYSKDEIDCFMVYYPKKEDIFKVDVEEAPDTDMRLRYDARVTNPNINKVEDYKY